MPICVWTIGHSNQSVERFLAVLERSGIEAVADVRRFPGSRRWPQFGAEALAQRLAGVGIVRLRIPPTMAGATAHSAATRITWPAPSSRLDWPG